MAWMRMMGAESVNYHRKRSSDGPTTTLAPPSIITPPEERRHWFGAAREREIWAWRVR